MGSDDTDGGVLAPRGCDARRNSTRDSAEGVGVSADTARERSRPAGRPHPPGEAIA